MAESTSVNVIDDDARDNRELIDDNESQSLTCEEIEAMRRFEQGLTCLISVCFIYRRIC